MLLTALSFRDNDDDDVVAPSLFCETELFVSAADVLGCFRDFEVEFIEFLFLVILFEENSVTVEDEEDDRFLLLDREFLSYVDDEVGPDPADPAGAAAEMAVAATDLDRTEFRLLAARVTTIIQQQEELAAA